MNWAQVKYPHKSIMVSEKVYESCIYSYCVLERLILTLRELQKRSKS